MDSYSKVFLLKSIAPSDSDSMLETMGYDLRKEYLQMVEAAKFNSDFPVLDIATGSGRMTSILSRFKYQIISGDITDEQREKALERITPEFEHYVKFIYLNTEDIPFEDDSISNLMCANTLHHLEKPELSIYNLIKIMKPSGKLVLSDFNDHGFDILDKVHLATKGSNHESGLMKMEEAVKLLKSSFDKVEILNTDLNITAITTNKKNDWRKSWDTNTQ